MPASLSKQLFKKKGVTRGGVRKVSRIILMEMEVKFKSLLILTKQLVERKPHFRAFECHRPSCERLQG